MKRLGIDVGGTFTDIVLVDEDTGRVTSTKVPTTPEDRVIGAMKGYHRILELADVSSNEIDFIGHGTTMATNMIVEGKGAKTALITTDGFRDILELRRASRHDRADLYDLQFDNPKPLVDRRWRLEVPERIRFDGSIETPLDLNVLRGYVEQIANSDVEAVAICFLHSYINPVHEKAALEELTRLLPDHFITASFQVNPEIQEYERMSSTCINAMLGPMCGRYIRTFETQLRETGFNGELLFMQSNGGLATTTAVAARPIGLLSSGPAGGVSAALRISAQAGLSGVILGDMGGTTFDVSLIRDSKPEMRTHGLLHTHAVRAPTIDIDSIGAGGGSIAWIDAGGGVRIGPESAAADPGPACYGRGGERPTVTDCNLVLGYIDPDSFLGGDFKLNTAAAEKAIEIHLAKPLGMSVMEAAWTVRSVANALMAQATRLMTVERGYDPREFAYMCYGGAGPVHAVDLADELDVKEVIIPSLPGLFSALGMVMADRLADVQIALEGDLTMIQSQTITDQLGQLQVQALDYLHAEKEEAEIHFLADCRYAGQPDALTFELDSTKIATGGRALNDHIRECFERDHIRMWNFVKSDQTVQLVNLRAQARLNSGWHGQVKAGNGAGTSENRRQRQVYVDGKKQAIPVYLRSELQTGQIIQGPAAIEEQSSCIVFNQSKTARIDDAGNLRITL